MTNKILTEIKCKYDKIVSIEDLKYNPRNRNIHPEEQLELYVKILEHQGIRSPVRVSKRSGVMTKGHGLVEALKRLDEKYAPVEYQDYDDEEMEYQDLIADNELQKWATTKFSDVNKDIQELGPFNLDLLGIKDFVVEPMEKFIEKINSGDENSEWVGMPEFEPAEENYIRVMLHFTSEDAREKYVKEKEVTISRKLKGVWIAHL